MSETKSDNADWKLVYAGRFANLVCFTNSLVVFYVCYLILTYAWNIYVGILIVVFSTTLFIHVGTTTSILLGLPAVTCDNLLSTNVCSLLTYASFWLLYIHGKIVHGYEIHGKENIPKTTGGLIVYPHMMIPYDILYLMGDFYFENGKPLWGIIHRNMQRICPGVCKILHFFSGKESLIEKLKRGEICSVAPGGGFEAVFGENQELLWNGRSGFAAVAKECGVPIIPMYTINGNEATPFRIFGFRKFFRKVYEVTRRVPFLPLVQLPVKLRIIIGEPIFCGTDESPEDFALRTKLAIYSLRDKYQRRPASTLLAFLDRFGYTPAVTEEDHA